MPRILTVDDSRPIRMIVSKAMVEFGFEVGEAEDGNDGLKKLAETKYDLVVLDITMPNLDGPGMLTKMRESGDKTPVLMLTSESKTSIVATLMKLGISDFVLKPFKADELRVKVLKALKLPADYTGGKPATNAEANDQRLMCLVIDDMDNVHKKLRTMILETQAHLETCLTVQEALNIARTKKFRLILVDSEIQEGGSAALVKQLRLLQPEAGIWGMALRSASNVTKEMRDLGYDDALLKPFSQEALNALVEQYAVKNEKLFSATEDLIRILAYSGKEERLDRYFTKLITDVKHVVEKLGEACFEKAILDVSQLVIVQPQRVAMFLSEIIKTAVDLGLALRVVGSPDLPKVLGGFEETKDLRCFTSIEEARAQAT